MIIGEAGRAIALGCQRVSAAADRLHLGEELATRDEVGIGGASLHAA
jgi:hypothetical protein